MSSPTCTLDAMPTDLLARVLEWTVPDIQSRLKWGETLCTDFTTFHRRRLVCRRFRQTFYQHPRLSQNLLVPKDIYFHPLSPQHFAGMLRWIHKHAGSTETVRLRRSIRQAQKRALIARMQLHAVVGLLAAAQAQLSAVWGLTSSGTTLNLLPSFRALATCALTSHPGSVLDLTPLQALSNLKVLNLNGPSSFTGLHLLPPLTELAFQRTDVGLTGDPSYGCLSTLRDLSMYHCTIRMRMHGLHSRGLVACEALQVLQCGDCIVSALDDTDAFWFGQDAGVLHFPPAMTLLTQLTTLQLDYTFTLHAEGHANLEWIYGLTALQQLTLYCDGPCRIGTNLSRLHKLTVVHLGTRQDYFAQADFEAEWVLATKWSSMSALKSLTLDSSAVKAGAELLTLTQLVHLQKLSFEECRVANAFTHECILQLYDSLSARRRDTVLSFDDILQDPASGF